MVNYSDERTTEGWKMGLENDVLFFPIGENEWVGQHVLWQRHYWIASNIRHQKPTYQSNPSILFKIRMLAILIKSKLRRKFQRDMKSDKCLVDMQTKPCEQKKTHDVFFTSCSKPPTQNFSQLFFPALKMTKMDFFFWFENLFHTALHFFFDGVNLSTIVFLVLGLRFLSFPCDTANGSQIQSFRSV